MNGDEMTARGRAQRANCVLKGRGWAVRRAINGPAFNEQIWPLMNNSDHSLPRVNTHTHTHIINHDAIVSECELGGLCEAQCPFDGSPQSTCKCGLGPAVPAGE